MACFIYYVFLINILLILCTNYSIFVVSIDDSHFQFKHAPRNSLKIVQDLASNDNGIGFQPPDQFQVDLSDSLKRRNKKFSLHPAPFSGPQHLKKLEELCFTYLDEKYKYKFCPFNNFTQEEVQGFQEPFQTVLGVWGEWVIENKKFKAMSFLKGMKCGPDTERNVKINLSCGTYNRLIKMMEPSKCKYEGLFETPLVCGRGSLLVYPRLTKELQMEWNRIETEKYHDILTQKGYEEEIKLLFLKAGFILSANLKSELNLQLTNDGDPECQDIKTALESKIQELEKELASKDSLISTLKEEIKEKNTSQLG